MKKEKTCKEIRNFKKKEKKEQMFYLTAFSDFSIDDTKIGQMRIICILLF